MHVEKVLVICLYICSAEHGFRTAYRCIGDLSNSFTVQLNCSVGEWIHVVHEAYGVGDNASCRLKSARSCSRYFNNTQNALVVNCNGKQSCRETMPKNNCSDTDAAAEVKYNCIKGSMNMCSPVTTRVNGSVYLHSPGFPDSVGVNSSCIVRITGKTLNVTLLEQYMRSGILNISGDGRQLWSYVCIGQYNRILPGQAAEIVIVYGNHDKNGSNLWLRVADSGQMNITIIKETLGASTTTTSTQQPSRSQSTSSPSTSDKPTTETTTRAQSTATASYRTATSTHGHTTNLTGSKATQTPSKSTTIVSTTGSIPDTDKSKVTEIVTGDPTTNTTTAVTTLTSATVGNTTMTTKDGEPSSTTTPSSGLGLIVWAASAVSGCVVTIVIVAIGVVLCRKRVKKSRPPLKTPGKPNFESPSELSSMNTEKHHNGFGQNDKCNQHLVIDAEFGAGGMQSLNTGPGFRTETSEKHQQGQYAKAEPLGSTVDRYDKSTFTVTRSEADNGSPHVIRDPNGSMADNDHQGICPMTEKDLYDGGFDELREAMVDNVVYDKFDSERENESVQDDSDNSPNNSKQTLSNTCEMIENDVYDGGPPQAANENNVDDLYDVGLDTSEGMVDNGLYDKFEYDREKESRQDELDTSANHSKLPCKDGMIENIFYERGPPHFEDPVGSVSDKDNHVGDGRLETSGEMVDSGLYEKSECDREKESLRDESESCVMKNGKNDCHMVENDVYERGPP